MTNIVPEVQNLNTFAMSDLTQSLSALPLTSQQSPSDNRLLSLPFLLKSSTLFIDAGALLNPMFPVFLSHLGPLLRENGAALMIPTSVRARLRKRAKSSRQLHEQIEPLFRLLEKYEDLYLVSYYGSASCTDFDAQLLSITQAAPLINPVTFITEDKSLLAKMCPLLYKEPPFGDSVQIAYINRQGTLSRFENAKSNEKKRIVT